MTKIHSYISSQKLVFWSNFSRPLFYGGIYIRVLSDGEGNMEEEANDESQVMHARPPAVN